MKRGYAIRARLLATAVGDCARPAAGGRRRKPRPAASERRPPAVARSSLIAVLDLRAVAATSPLLALARGVAIVVVEAERPIVDAVTPPGPEPVLGGR